MYRSLLILFFILIFFDGVIAQSNQVASTQQFRLAERIVRIAEVGQLSDSVNVWGDVGSSGRYLVPRNTSLNKLLTYAFGPRTLRDGQTNLDWSKMRVEIYIHEYDKNTGEPIITEFKYRLEEQFPAELHAYKVKNNQIVTVRVKRRPSFRDYLGVFASTVSAVASTIILLDRLGGN